MANIGNLAFKIVARAGDALKTMGTFKTQVSSFTSSIGATLNRTALGGFTMGLGGKMMGVFGGLGTALIAGLGGAPDFIKEQIAKIKELSLVGMKADSLGVASDQYMSLINNAKRFGLEQTDVNKILFKVGTVKGVPPGVNPDEWLKADAVGRLKLFGDSIKDMPAGEKMNAVKDAFGRMGAAVLPVLAQGSKGIDEFTRKQREMGLLLDPKQMAAITRAKMALPKFDMIFEGFKLQATAGIAPLIETIGNALSKATPFILKVVRVGSELMAIWYEVMAGAWGGIFGFIGDSFEQIFVQTGALQSAMEAFGGEGLSVGDKFKAVLWGIAKGFAYVWDTIKTGVAVSFVGPLGIAFVTVGTAMEAMGIKGGTAIKQAGIGMSAWAIENVMNWGATEAKVDGFFLTMIAKQAMVGRQAEETAQTIKAAYSAVGASVMGGKEAISIEARFRTEGMLNPFRQGQRDVVDAIRAMDRRVVEQLKAGRGPRLDLGEV